MKTEVKTVDDKNKLIAEFLGAKPNIKGEYDLWSTTDLNSIFQDDGDPYVETRHSNYFGKEMLFNTSWDWLMPVVEKIENFGFEFLIVEDRVKIAHNTDHSIEVIIDFTSGRRKIETVYQALVEFIKWYNEYTYNEKTEVEVRENINQI